jgi:signal peptidase II
MTVAIVILIIFLDQLSKYLVTRQLELHQSIPVLSGIFHLTLVHNRGAAFGILRNQLYLFIAISLGAIFVIVSHLRHQKNRSQMLQTVALSGILAGAVGNLIDRIRFGYVIDFFDFRIWPVFNIADSAITVGAIVVGISLLVKSKGTA